MAVSFPLNLENQSGKDGLWLQDKTVGVGPQWRHEGQEAGTALSSPQSPSPSEGREALLTLTQSILEAKLPS